METARTPLKLIRNSEEVYFGKAKDVVGDLRSIVAGLVSTTFANNATGIAPLTETIKEKATHQEMINSMKR